MRLTLKLPLQAPRAIALALLLLFAWSCSPAGDVSAGPDSATIWLIVRHAEKAAEPADDPPLTEEGVARAATLARMASGSDVAAVYATQYLRTQRTVEPAAGQLGLEVQTTDAADLDALVDQVFSQHRGETVLAAAHSNTVPMLVEKLTGSPVPPIEEHVYDSLYVVTAWGEGQGRAVLLRYGEPSESAPQ